tara:strand:+ start:73 stop:525 length:453 start_codon:yes stop_codon:yes gene_type:complete
MMVPFVNSWTSLFESSGLGAVCAIAVAVIRGWMTRVVFEESVRKTLGITCMFMWIILTALAFGEVFDGLGAGRALEDLFVGQLGLNPWVIILMQLSFLLIGTFLDDMAMLVIVAAPLCSSCQGAGVRSDLVRGTLYDHLRNRSYDSALWL